MTSPLATILHRAVAWLRRNPTARADALELTAAAVRVRAGDRYREGRPDAARRLRERATVLEARAQQLRHASGPTPTRR